MLFFVLVIYLYIDFSIGSFFFYLLQPPFIGFEVVNNCVVFREENTSSFAFERQEWKVSRTEWKR